MTQHQHDLLAEIYELREPKKVSLISIQTEIWRLLVMAVITNVKAMPSLSYGCGLRVGEVVRLKAGDIVSTQKIIRVVQAEGRKDRHVMLPDDVLALLRTWWNKSHARHYD